MGILKRRFWFLLPVIVLVLVAGSRNDTRLYRNTKAIHRTIKLMYAAVPLQEKYSCNWIRTMKRQYNLCKNDPGMAEVLFNARKLAITQCEEQFRFARWNCSRPTKLFKNVFRETALLYSMISSALMYSVARACSDGKLVNCHCPKEQISGVELSALKWGLCSDNLKYGRQFVKKFLQLNKKYDNQHQILHHDSEVGVSTIYENVKKICKCQGLSGSCEMEICWKTMSSYEKISLALSNKYHNALITNLANRNGMPIRRDSKKRTLFYIVESPSFCYLTRGRRCLGPENCATICCGRGFNSKSVLHEEYCNCEWNQRSQVKCDNCSIYKQQNFCQ